MQVLTNGDVKPSGRVLRLCPTFCLREARWWLQLEVRKTSNLHYTTALHTISPVFSHHLSKYKGINPSEMIRQAIERRSQRRKMTLNDDDDD